jgi:glycosyltransferase involved in cell wall biosynthesis
VISVLLPTYNQAAFLPDALAGLDAQTFKDFEVIACDDGSTDGTGAILKAAGVRTVTHGYNKGTAAAINLAAVMSSGDLMTWVSSDNRMHPDWLATLAAAMKPGVGAVYSAYNRCEQGTKPRAVRQGPYDPTALIGSDACYFGPSFLIRRSAWQSHRGGTAHDWDNWSRVEEACWFEALKIVYVDAVLCDYRCGPWCTARARADLYDAPKWRAEAMERRQSRGVHQTVG